MCRRLILTAVLLALTAGLAVAKSGGGTRTEDRWNPQHIDSLPLEVRRAVAIYARICGGVLAAEHSFALYFRRGAVNLIGLHFEHLCCADRSAISSAAGCLHQ